MSNKTTAGEQMRSIFDDTEESQSGATIILVAFLFTVLLGFAAFAVDFGWLYLNGIRIQHGADAAALAGVVYEPGDQARAFSTAHETAKTNGYDNSVSGTTVVPNDFTSDPASVENQYQLSVAIEHEVDTFFMRVFGIDTISIGKTAVAEYVLPLPMGSDWPYFGTDPSDPTRQPNFWANIHGYYTGSQMGDRYASQCADGSSGETCSGGNFNTIRRPTTMSGGVPVTGGYLYGIELDGGDGLQVEIFDGPFYNIDQGGGDYFLVGDNEQGGSNNPGPVTWFLLYAPDPTPLNTADNGPPLCSVRYDPQFTFADFDGDGDVGSRSGSDWTADPDDDFTGDGLFDWDDVALGLAAETPPRTLDDLWDPLCAASISGIGDGIYPLRVVIEPPAPGVDHRGLNRYSMRASTTTGNQPRFYGLGDMAIYVNFEGNQASFNLAEVYPVHAGKELVIELWDADSGNNGVEIQMPDGTTPTCSWENISGTRSWGPGVCDLTFSPDFHNDHMQIRIDIPPGYTCDPAVDCWWTIAVDYPGGANDTTTWSTRIEGNPVKLVK